MKSSKFPFPHCDLCGRYAYVGENRAMWTTMTLKSSTIRLETKAVLCTECTKNIHIRIQKTRDQQISELVRGPWF